MNLIGCGRVGQTLAHLWQRSGAMQVAGLYSRSLTSAQAAQTFIGAVEVADDLARLPPADFWLLAVPDSAIAEVAAQLAAVAPAPDPDPDPDPDRPAPIALHCSGFLASSALAPLAERGWRVASAHPVRSFASPVIATAQFAGTPVGLEGDDSALPALREALAAIGAQCFDLRHEAKPLYHAAAVFSNNFTVVLQGIAQGLWQQAGVSEAMGQTLMQTLLRSTLENLHGQPPAQALTGPAARGDTAVVEAQGRAVAQWNGRAGEVYAQLSELARQLKTHERIGD